MSEEVEKINLDDYVATGEGATAVSYTHKTRDTIAKLYHPGFEADCAKKDFLTSCTAFDLGVPTPKPIRLITDGERFGAEYELIRNKRSFSRIISEEPGRLQELSLTFAEMAKRLHSTKADTTKLVSTKEKLSKRPWLLSIRFPTPRLAFMAICKSAMSLPMESERFGLIWVISAMVTLVGIWECCGA